MTNKDLLKDDDKIDFGAIFRMWLRYWWVFAVCVAGCFGLAFLYLSIKSTTYDVKGSVILNQNIEQKGTLGGALGALVPTFSLGGNGSKLVEDEMYRMQSHTNLCEVVRRTGINYAYWSKNGLFERKKWYYNDSPIVISLPGAVMDTLPTTQFKIDVPADGKKIKVTVKQKGETVVKTTYPSFPFMVKTPGGNFHVALTERYEPGEKLGFNAILMSPDVKAEALYEKIFIAPKSKKSNILSMKTEETRTDRGLDVMHALVDVYNDRSLKESRADAENSISFIEERLLDLYNQLENSDSRIESYKREHEIVDAEAEAEYIFKKKETVEGKIIEVQTRIGVLEMIIDFMRSDAHRYSLLPFTEDIPEAPISAYNTMVLELMQLETNPKGNAAAIKSLTSQIDALRANMLTTLDRELAAQRIASADLNRVSGSSKSRMEGVPTMERELLGLYRSQKIQSTIYSFLLQKREEAQMQATREVPPGKMVEEFYVSSKPASPNKLLILALALAFGILMPAAGLYCVMLWQRHCDRAAQVKPLAEKLAEE